MQGYFITGTDTGVGKTLLLGAIVKALSNAGKRVGVMKPFESGCRRQNSRIIPEDAVFLKKMAGCLEDLALICPYALEHPLAPGVAAEMEHVKVDIGKIKENFFQMGLQYDLLFVEGAGGLLVPIDKNFLIIDLIKLLNLPLIIVARTALGTINHTLLTVRQAQHRAIKVSGVILNQLAPETGTAEKTNPAVIKRLSNVPVIGQVPYIPAEQRMDPEFLATIAKKNIALSVFKDRTQSKAFSNEILRSGRETGKSPDTRTLAKAIFTAMNSRELGGLDQCLAENAVMDFPGAGFIKGRRRILVFLKALLRKYPRLTFAVEEIIVSDDRACVVWTNKGQDRRHKPYSNRGITLVHVCDEHIDFLSDYFKDTSFVNPL